jgi:phosphate transport system substrate-binding protein
MAASADGARRRRRSRRALVLALAVVASCVTAVVGAPGRAVADGPRVTGTGASFPQIELEDWVVQIARAPYNLSVNYVPAGSTVGRQSYIDGTHDYGVSDIPFQPGELERSSDYRPFTYVPISAGGVGFMFNIADAVGEQITELNLTPRTVCRMFTERGMRWNDPEVVADNPGVPLPDANIVPVMRSDGAGTSFVFSAYCIETVPDVWAAFIALVGSDPVLSSGADRPFFDGQPTSKWPAFAGTVSYGADGVAGVVANPATGANAITYNEAGFADKYGLPNAWVRNAAGIYMQPTARAVNTALAYAIPADDGTFTLEYNAPDPGAYFPATYSYVIAPTDPADLSADKGRVLATFLYYCATAGQERAEDLGYAPLSRQVTEIALRAIPRIPGAPPPPSLDGTPATDPPSTIPVTSTTAPGQGSSTTAGGGGPGSPSTAAGDESGTTAPGGGVGGGGGGGGSQGGGGASRGGTAPVTVPVTAADGSVVTTPDGAVVTAAVSNGTAVIDGVVVAVGGGEGDDGVDEAALDAVEPIAARGPDRHEVAWMFVQGAALFLVGSAFAMGLRARRSR